MSIGPREMFDTDEGESPLPFSDDDLRLMKSFKIKMD